MTEQEHEEPTARVAMIWPERVKAAVREKAGPRGMTEFILEAVRVALGDDYPEYVAHPATPAEPTGAPELDEAPQVVQPQYVPPEPVFEPKPAPIPEPTRPAAPKPEPEPTPVPTPAFEPRSKGNRDDLFAKVMAKTGGKLDGISGLKLASDIPKPAAREPEPEKCPNCGDVLVDGECWSC